MHLIEPFVSNFSMIDLIVISLIGALGIAIVLDRVMSVQKATLLDWISVLFFGLASTLIPMKLIGDIVLCIIVSIIPIILIGKVELSLMKLGLVLVGKISVDDM